MDMHKVIESSFIECPYIGENGGCETCVLGLSPQECEEALYEYLLNEFAK